MKSKQAYEQKVQAQLDAWSAEMDKLKAKARQADADAQLELNDEIEKLQAKRQVAEQKFEELKAAGDDAWDDMKQGIDSAASALGSSLRSAMGRFA